MAISEAEFPAIQGLTSSTNTGRLEQIGARAASGKEMSVPEIKEVGQQFEAMLLRQLLTTMRRSIPKNELFGESSASEIYKDLFDEKLADQIAAASQTGIGELISQEIIRQQEQINPMSTPPRMLPLREGESTLHPLNQNSPAWKAIVRDEPVFHRIPDQNNSFLPISEKRGSGNKVDIVG